MTKKMYVYISLPKNVDIDCIQFVVVQDEEQIANLEIEKLDLQKEE